MISLSEEVSSGLQPKRGLDIQSLDFIRGIAAVYVVMSHVRGSFFAGGQQLLAEAGPGGLALIDKIFLALLQFTALGTEFVIVFFVVGGFSMAHSLDGNPKLMDFYRKRFVRIWPPYVAAVLLAGLVSAIACYFAPDSAAGTLFSQKYSNGSWMLRHLTYIEANTFLTPQFWSLPHEVLFYLLCPLILIGRTRVLFLLLAAVVMFSAGVLVNGIHLNPSPSFFVNFATNSLLYFAIGAALYHYRQLVPNLSGVAFMGVLVLGIGLTIIIKQFLRGGATTPTSLIMVVLAVVSIINLPRFMGAIPSWANLGFMSYSIYIFHAQLIGFLRFALQYWLGLEQQDMRSYLAWTLVVPPILLVCWLLYRVTERPRNNYLAALRQRERLALP